MAALDAVFDPELDESVTSMGFIETVALRGRTAEITFRLPTFWCSANFAYLMARDMREAVERLAFIDDARVRLVDHFAARKINQGVAIGLGFAAAFPGEAASDLGDLRRAFRERAFLGRQDQLLQKLAERCWSVDSMLALSVADLEACPMTLIRKCVGRRRAISRCGVMRALRPRRATRRSSRWPASRSVPKPTQHIGATPGASAQPPRRTLKCAGFNSKRASPIPFRAANPEQREVGPGRAIDGEVSD